MLAKSPCHASANVLPSAAAASGYFSQLNAKLRLLRRELPHHNGEVSSVCRTVYRECVQRYLMRVRVDFRNAKKVTICADKSKVGRFQTTLAYIYNLDRQIGAVLPPQAILEIVVASLAQVQPAFSKFMLEFVCSLERQQCVAPAVAAWAASCSGKARADLDQGQCV